MSRDLTAPVVVAKRQVNELPPEELQAEARGGRRSLCTINLARMDAAEAKSSKIHSEMKVRAAIVHQEQAKLAEQRADAEWHDANAKQRAEIREQEEWERARVKAEQDVRRLMEIEALDKKHREQLVAEKRPKGAKSKK